MTSFDILLLDGEDASNEVQFSYRPIPSFPGYYAGTDGCIYKSRAAATGHVLKRLSSYDQDGYRMVRVVDIHGVEKKRLVHRLVLEAFRGDPMPGYQGSHEDGNKSNNRPSNLLWRTPKKNNELKVEHGTHVCGEMVNTAKLTGEQVREFRERYANGEAISALSKELDITISCGSQIAYGRSWKHIVPATHTLKEPEAKVYVGDCRKVMKGFGDGTCPLIFADPPFGQGVKYADWDDSMPVIDYARFTRQWLDECCRLLAPNGSFWINVPDSLAAGIVLYLKRKGLELVSWCCWHYRFGVWRPSNFIGSKTHVLYFARSKADRIWNGQDILVPSDRASKYDDPRTRDTQNPGKRVPLDVWGVDGEYWGRVQGNNQERSKQHPNQLPEVYLERIIRCASNVGDMVLDPFLGSGTTQVVARALLRPSVGIEISKAYATSAARRILRGPVRVKPIPLTDGIRQRSLLESTKAPV